MSESIEDLVAIAEDESAVAKRVAEIGPSDYDDLMRSIDKVMESNGGAGPNPIHDPEPFGWLMRASVVAEYYEKRVFVV